MARALLWGCYPGRAAPRVLRGAVVIHQTAPSNGCSPQSCSLSCSCLGHPVAWQQLGTLLSSLPSAGLGSAFVGEEQRYPCTLMTDVLFGHVCILRVNVGSRKASDTAEFPLSLRD